ncbi:hypothetical protein M8A51_10600 [Schlegelella sp. S2-27]|uniref:Uncharacterized protein n=1 Tax=Caldimonas mangrovi TaxID=2944811 RepID=A0ABT0YNY1_9BURK|nr:hypothetical protein [Caldimonas mangrovi]MCM5679982.1 hypothetical protein [Caldimonas mangrovi]
MPTFQGLHTHALTGRQFAYQGEYQVEGQVARWHARIEQGGRVVDELEGTAIFNSADMDAVKAVMVGVQSRIDAADYDIP